MQSVIHLIFSAVSGTILVLASCMLAAPLLALLVALGCIVGAWLTVRRGCWETRIHALEQRRSEGSGIRGLHRSTLG
ncbi:MAG: hypothetical protein EA417_06085 [Gammaproteobacteria bacterium]|nr:MAG: hypothetical protein EA417_06085 [Gammaproteobacteria bacterium]